MDWASSWTSKRQLARDRNPFKLPEFPPGVKPQEHKLAYDQAESGCDWGTQQWSQWSGGGWGAEFEMEGLTFPGYAYLSELAQRPEFRIFSETIATEMTRKWITFQVVVKEGDEKKEDDDEQEGIRENRIRFAGGTVHNEEESEEALDREPDSDAETQPSETDKQSEKSAKIQELNDEFDRLQVRDVFKLAAIHDGFFGRGHVFLDFSEDEAELEYSTGGELSTDIGDGRSEASYSKVSEGSFRRLKNVEPVWTYPTTYNAVNPLKDSWYSPQVWYVLGREIHCSRLLTFIGRPVPDMLKPAYAFGGLSLSQMALPYVQIWLNTRKNIANLIRAFSVMVLKTNLSTVIQPGGLGTLTNRAAAFNATRDNEGLMVVDKETEDFANVSVPLGGLHELQAQAQEHMASVARIPLVKFTGISPTGLNASSEGEMRAFYDSIHAYQESFFRKNLTIVMHFVMLSLWGEIDEEIGFEFEPLWAMTEKEEAEIRKLEAETDDILINGCAALHPEESRKRIAKDPDTPYQDIDVEDVPEPPDVGDPGQLGGKINLRGTSVFGGGAKSSQGGKGGFGGEGDSAIAGDERPIVAFPRNGDGLFIEPEELSPKVQMTIDHNRERFAKHYNYADEFYGEQNSYDSQGDYNCGRCNQADGDKCLLVKIARIDRAAGSCRQWESVREGDPEMPLYRESTDLAAYGVATNGKGFGCARCPYSKPAKNTDDLGRRHWCGFGGFHQTPTACCALNGAETEGGEGGGEDATFPFAADKSPHRELTQVFSEAKDADILGYLCDFDNIRSVPNRTKWHAHYDGGRDEIDIEEKFWSLSHEDQVHTLLHEAGHRGQKIASKVYEAFKKDHLNNIELFREIANKVHLSDLQEHGPPKDLAEEVWAESYSRFALGLKMPRELREFWQHYAT